MVKSKLTSTKDGIRISVAPSDIPRSEFITEDRAKLVKKTLMNKKARQQFTNQSGYHVLELYRDFFGEKSVDYILKNSKTQYDSAELSSNIGGRVLSRFAGKSKVDLRYDTIPSHASKGRGKRVMIHEFAHVLFRDLRQPFINDKSVTEGIAVMTEIILYHKTPTEPNEYKAYAIRFFKALQELAKKKHKHPFEVYRSMAGGCGNATKRDVLGKEIEEEIAKLENYNTSYNMRTLQYVDTKREALYDEMVYIINSEWLPAIGFDKNIR